MDHLLSLIVGIGLLVLVGVFLRRLWRAVTNPAVAYQLGKKTRNLGRSSRRTVETAAYTAGRASGAVEEAAGTVTRPFREGRASAKRKVEGPESGA